MSDPNNKSHICVDFDGVIHMYSSGWMGACVITDDPVPGALEWLAEMVHDHPEFQICIYSSRSKEPGAIDAMKAWLKKHLMAWYESLKLDSDELGPASDFVLAGLEFPTQKPAANLLIDDRAFCFEGTFPTAEWIKAYRPWNKRSTPQVVINMAAAAKIDVLPDPSAVPAELISDIYREAWSGTAEAMYNHYGASVCWKAVSGHPMPAWKDLPPRISGAWCCAAEAAHQHWKRHGMQVDKAQALVETFGDPQKLLEENELLKKQLEELRADGTGKSL